MQFSAYLLTPTISKRFYKNKTIVSSCFLLQLKHCLTETDHVSFILNKYSSKQTNTFNILLMLMNSLSRFATPSVYKYFVCLLLLNLYHILLARRLIAFKIHTEHACF